MEYIVWAANGEKIKEKYDALGKLNKEERLWADLLLAEKISVVGGGMTVTLHRNSLAGIAKFQNFKRKWQQWWNGIGQKKYREHVKSAKTAFRKNYVRVDGFYQHKSESEVKLTEDEIRWIKKEYLKSKKR